MTKKHFEALAQQIKLISDLKARCSAATAVAIVARAENSRFSQDRFYTACGLQLDAYRIAARAA